MIHIYFCVCVCVCVAFSVTSFTKQHLMFFFSPLLFLSPLFVFCPGPDLKEALSHTHTHIQRHLKSVCGLPPARSHTHTHTQRRPVTVRIREYQVGASTWGGEKKRKKQSHCPLAALFSTPKCLKFGNFDITG